MAEVPVRANGHAVPLDVCSYCQSVWFDPREFDEIWPVPVAELDASAGRELPEKAREAIALAALRVDEMRHRGDDFSDEAPEEVWKWLPALLGMPVEHDVNAVRIWPWATWGLAAVMALTLALTYQQLESVVFDYGLIPSALFRHGGITFLTSFFLHAGLLHLIGNAYFLLVFGDNVEEELGTWRFLLLVGAAALVGDLAHAAADPRSDTPCVGASGGISGVITYYALRFPRAKLGFMFRYWTYFRWITMPAWFALVLWFLLQLWLAHGQIAGLTNVSALAHLGGAAVGLGAWALGRKQ
jgi:membrane associated rhomboid family serine protease